MMRNLLRIASLVLTLIFFAACTNQPQDVPVHMPSETEEGTAGWWYQASDGSSLQPGDDAPSGITAQNGTSGSPAVFPDLDVPPGLVPVTITIPEGFTFLQIAQRLEANGVVSAQAFFDAAQGYEVQSFDTPFSPDSAYFFEGFLFPDTYEFFLNEEPVSVLRKFLNNYAAKSGMPDYDTLILASIIERETRSDEHMAMVSSVFHNRLAIDMMLQADATREYVNQHITGSPLVAPSPDFAPLYNTYRRTGLPVGPICNPGLRAIQAAQNPADTEYLFYFFGMDNTNHYTRTYAEHQAAMARIGVNFGR